MTTIIVNIANKSAPKVERTVSVEGYLTTTRKVGDYVYFVTNRSPEYRVLMSPGLRTEQILPTVIDSKMGDAPRPLVGCDDVKYFPGYVTPEYLIVSALNVKDAAADLTSEVILGNSNNVYMSTKNLYVATGAVEMNAKEWDYSKTQVYKFGVDKGQVSFDGSARVEGRILNQFSMDEMGDTFRMATTKDRNWTTGALSENQVHILDKDMKALGSLTGLAKGEQIKSARFMGNRLYLVTFESIDPLFVIDLSNANAPKVLGELKIPGWSDYLHPYDENHILGFGYETEVQKDASGKIIEPEFFTWDMIVGLKVSLFNVADVTAPKEVGSVVLGDKNSSTPLTYDHKALLFDKTRNIVAFPVQLMKKVGEITSKTCRTVNGAEVCEVSYTYDDIKTDFAGAIVLGVDTATGLFEKGRITHYAPGVDLETMDWEDRYGDMINRILYIGSNFFTVANGSVKETNMNSFEAGRFLKLKD